jgi:hypothetical protein
MWVTLDCSLLRKGRVMRLLIVASAGAAMLVAAAVSGPLSAQSTQNNGKDATKVYAYKKAAPATTQPSPSAYVPMTDAPQSRPDLIPNSVPYGTPTWWDLMGRSAAGDGSQ